MTFSSSKNWRKKHTTVGIFPQSNKNNLRNNDKIDIPSTRIQDRFISWPGTCISMKSGGFKLLLWRAQLPFLVEVEKTIFHY